MVSNKLIPYTWMVLSDGTEQQPKITRTEQMINVGAEILLGVSYRNLLLLFKGFV